MRSTHQIPTVAMVAATIVAALVGGAPVVEPVAPRPAPVICHVATAGSDLLRSTRCAEDTLTFRLGYTPQRAHLPGGEPVDVEPDGACSWLPDRPLGFDFRNACRRHDLGYDLIRVGWVDGSAKTHIDRALRDDMVDACAHWAGLRGLACRAMATAAWVATALAPTPTDPDPGSFTAPAATRPPAQELT